MAYIRFSKCSDKCIRDSMAENISIRMSLKSLRMGNIHAAKDELPTGYQTVHVISNA